MSSRLLVEIRKVARRRGLLVVLTLPAVVAVLTYVGMSNEVRHQYDRQLDTLAIVEAAVDDGTMSAEAAELRTAAVETELARLAGAEQMLGFPRSIQMGMQTFATAGALFVALAVAAAVGAEFRWGTYRNNLAYGDPRHRHALLLVAAPLGLALVALLATAAVTAAVGLIHAPIVVGPPAPAESLGWQGVAAGATAAITSTVLWAAAATAIAIVTRSMGTAVATATIVWFANLMAAMVFPSMRSWALDAGVVALALHDSNLTTHGLFYPAGISPQHLGNPFIGTVATLLVAAVLSSTATWRYKTMDLL